MKKILVSIFAVACMSAGIAQATPVTTWSVTARGTILTGDDPFGVFGSAGQNLGGLAYTLTTIGRVDSGNNTLIDYQAVHQVVNENLPISIIVTVNNHTVGFDLPAGVSDQTLVSGALHQEWASPYDAIHSQVDGNRDGFLIEAEIWAYAKDKTYAFVPSTDFAQSLRVDASSALNMTSFFQFERYSPLSATSFYGRPTSITLNDSTVPTTAYTPELPEPSSYMLLALGVAAMGTIHRRKSTRSN
jgi:hypothetical protein